MPELPEVETVVQSIRDQLIGNEFENIEIRWPKVLYNFSKSDFLRNLAKRKIERVDRRAKFIIIGFNKSILAIHLRMTGKLYFQTKKTYISYYYNEQWQLFNIRRHKKVWEILLL